MKYLLLLLIPIFLIPLVNADIPPSGSFKMINSTSGNVTAQFTNSFVTFEGSGITITPNYNLNKITFTASSGGATINDPAFACSGTDKVTNISVNNSTGQWIISCSADVGGSFSYSDPNAVRTNQTNTYTAGMKQTFASSATTAGINLNGVAADPSSLNNGDIWRDTTQKFFKGRLGGTTYKFVMDNKTQTLTNKIMSFTDNTFKSTNSALGDILKADSSGNYKRFAKGSALQQIRVNAGGNDLEYFTPSASSGPTVLGADVTCTATATYCNVFTVPLTASSGNFLNVKLIGDSNTAGGAIQMRVQFDNAGNNGYCVYRTFTTATAEVLDVLATTTTTDTGETVWLAGANVPMPLTIDCGFETDASPGNALVEIQAEVASTITIQKGSYYIKTP